jgi:hypothetical protein
MAAAFPVALTGWDGDALLRGAVRTCWIDSIRQGRFARVTRDIVRCSISQRRLPPVGFRTALKRLFGRTPTPHFPTWIDPDFERRLRLRDRFREHNRPQKESSPRDATRINLGLPLWTSLLDSYDPGWTGCALDARHPLVDMRVMTFAIALPTVPWCMAKELLRRCLADMPREIRERPKTPLRGDPVTATLKNKVGVSSECLLPEMELGRFVKPGSVLVPEPGVGVSDVWSALTPLSLNCWLKGRARSRS